MKIGKSKIVEPIPIIEVNDERISILFNDRTLLHEKRVPDFAVYIDETVWNQFMERANSEYSLHNHESAGIILGSYLSDRHGRFVYGTQFEAGYGRDTTAVFCEISVHDQIRISQRSKEMNLLQLVWIHSHPSFGAFYSNTDKRTLKSSYWCQHQTGIVVDNVHDEYLGFRVRNGYVYEFRQIYIIADKNSFTALHPFSKSAGKRFYIRSNRAGQ